MSAAGQAVHCFSAISSAATAVFCSTPLESSAILAVVRLCACIMAMHVGKLPHNIGPPTSFVSLSSNFRSSDRDAAIAILASRDFQGVSALATHLLPAGTVCVAVSLIDIEVLKVHTHNPSDMPLQGFYDAHAHMSSAALRTFPLSIDVSASRWALGFGFFALKCTCHPFSMKLEILVAQNVSPVIGTRPPC